MAVTKMQKLTVIGLNSERTAFLHELMRLGVVEINSQEGVVNDEEWMPDIFRTSNSADVSRLEADIARVSVALEAINQHDGSKKPLFATRKEIRRNAFVDHMNATKTATERNVDRAVEAQRVITEAQTEINRLKTIMTGLTPWEKLDVPLDMTETVFSCVILGIVGMKVNLAQLQTEALAAVPSAVIEEVGSDKQQRYLCFLCLKEEKDALYEALRAFSFSPVTLAGEKGTPADQIQHAQREIVSLEENIRKQEAVLAELSSGKNDIEFLYDSLCMRRDRAKVVGDMLSTETVFYFDGWMPKWSRERVEELLTRYEFYYDIAEPEPEEEVPILLHNNGIITPFEGVTSMYSLPSRQDIDPTALLAPFYFIFFGLMLSDAAYGIILSVGCALILKKFRLEGTMYRMIKMFFYCGISTFIWGALFGGWFGDFFTVAARTMFDKELVISPLWFNPLEEPMKLLIFSLILGGIHIFVGMGVQAYMYIRDGQPLDALFDIGLWYVLLIGLVLFGVGGSLAPALATVGKYMSIVGAAGILVTGGRKKKGFGKIVGGLSSLYGITSYLSDVLSYSRLLALGLATGVLAQVINTLGSLAGGGIFGSLVLIVVFLAGTVFNMAINVLGAFVHSCRLQYVEFFGKFYTGGGKLFRPFERKTKYVKIIEEDVEDGR